MHQVTIHQNIKIREAPDDDAAERLSLRNASGFPVDLAVTLGALPDCFICDSGEA